MQVKDVEAAAARAAFESSHIIEEAMAQAASVKRRAEQQVGRRCSRCQCMSGKHDQSIQVSHMLCS